ncbi:uncharacterized protein LOC111750031 [Loxodonta africana]|uniref:uncharacterized protein LOC111750031 n=1 Tax=Loxodonta africana TaxID=9785 RepID=UPI0030CE486C
MKEQRTQLSTEWNKKLTENKENYGAEVPYQLTRMGLPSWATAPKGLRQGVRKATLWSSQQKTEHLITRDTRFPTSHPSYLYEASVACQWATVAQPERYQLTAAQIHHLGTQPPRTADREYRKATPWSSQQETKHGALHCHCPFLTGHAVPPGKRDISSLPPPILYRPNSQCPHHHIFLNLLLLFIYFGICLIVGFFSLSSLFSFLPSAHLAPCTTHATSRWAEAPCSAREPPAHSLARSAPAPLTESYSTTISFTLFIYVFVLLHFCLLFLTLLFFVFLLSLLSLTHLALHITSSPFLLPICTIHQVSCPRALPTQSPRPCPA